MGPNRTEPNRTIYIKQKPNQIVYNISSQLNQTFQGKDKINHLNQKVYMCACVCESV